jgi:hypothetical protein
MFREALKSLAETTQGWDVEIVAVVDNDKESAQIALE